MRILVTNDDGVHAPGLAALTRALAGWAAEAPGREVVVVAPLANHSGAAAAVGVVYERDAIPYRAARLPGAESVPAYGLDCPPALAVIVGCLGGFGAKPDLIVSGINLGVNVGRSVLHSGTVGAVLTGAQHGVRGLAVSLRAGGDHDHFDTAGALAVSMLQPLAAAPERTVLNLNVPSLPLDTLKGVRVGRIGGAGLITAAAETPLPDGHRPGDPVPEEGQVVLRMGAAVPSLGDVDDEDEVDDAALVAHGWASVTPVLGVRADPAPAAADVAAAAAVAGNRLARGDRPQVVAP